MSSENKKIPVVVILGHVDAGKSSILDYVCRTNTVAKECGGITQHVGVYEAEIKEQMITLIDTPGHAAFSAVRSRGAKIADLAILVVAADQGVQPQTKEAISYLKETDLPLMVVFNKIDLTTENLNSIKGQLNKEGITVESMGGNVPALEVSAKSGQGMEDLMEMILLMTEMENHPADLNGPAKGVVIESHQDPFRGPVATLIINQGQLKAGELIATSSACGKVKSLADYRGKSIDQAGSGKAVVVIGFSSVPKAGEEFQVYQNLSEAEEQMKNQEVCRTSSISEDAYNVIIKADVNSSLEAIESILKEIPQEKIKINIIEARTGSVTQNDANLAQTTQAEIIGFNVGLASGVRNLLEKYQINFKNFDIIYKLSEYVAETLEKRRQPEEVRRVVGQMEVVAIFKTEKSRQIVGGNVISGQIEKEAKLDVFRGKEKIGQGKIVSLECRKKEVELVPRGQQAGILYEGRGRIEEGDLIEAYFIDLV